MQRVEETHTRQLVGTASVSRRLRGTGIGGPSNSSATTTTAAAAAPIEGEKRKKPPLRRFRLKTSASSPSSRTITALSVMQHFPPCFWPPLMLTSYCPVVAPGIFTLVSAAPPHKPRNRSISFKRDAIRRFNHVAANDIISSFPLDVRPTCISFQLILFRRDKIKRRRYKSNLIFIYILFAVRGEKSIGKLKELFYADEMPTDFCITRFAHTHT